MYIDYISRIRQITLGDLNCIFVGNSIKISVSLKMQTNKFQVPLTYFCLNRIAERRVEIYEFYW